VKRQISLMISVVFFEDNKQLELKNRDVNPILWGRGVNREVCKIKGSTHLSSCTYLLYSKDQIPINVSYAQRARGIFAE